MIMENDVKDWISEELKKHFKGDACINHFWENETFWYSIKENGNFPVYEVKYTHDQSGSRIEWESAKKINPHSKFIPPQEVGDANITMGGENPPKK